MLSETVSNALLLTGGNKATETAKFMSLFVKYFDLLIFRSFTTNSTGERNDYRLHPGMLMTIGWM